MEGLCNHLLDSASTAEGEGHEEGGLATDLGSQGVGAVKAHNRHCCCANLARDFGKTIADNLDCNWDPFVRQDQIL